MNQEESKLNNQPPHSMKDSVLSALQKENVQMKPRWHFVLRGIFLVLGIIIILLTALYVSSSIVFSLRQTGVWLVPYFGFSGWLTFVRSLPWLLLILMVAFIVILEILVKRYEFAYGKPFMYSAVVILLLVIAGGVALGMTSLHEWNEDPLSSTYTQPHEVTVGTVTSETFSKNGSTYMIQDAHGQKITVSADKNTSLPDGRLKVGDQALIIGRRDDGQVQAKGIKKVTGRIPLPIPAQVQIQIIVPSNQSSPQSFQNSLTLPVPTM